MIHANTVTFEEMDRNELASELVKVAIAGIAAFASAVLGYLWAAWKKPGRNEVEGMLRPLKDELAQLQVRSAQSATRDDLDRAVKALEARSDLQWRDVHMMLTSLQSDLRAWRDKE